MAIIPPRGVELSAVNPLDAKDLVNSGGQSDAESGALSKSSFCNNPAFSELLRVWQHLPDVTQRHILDLLQEVHNPSASREQ